MPINKKKNRTFFRAPISRGIALSEENSTPRIDRKNNIIYGVSVASIGEARGHNVELDEKFINQVVEFGNKPKLGIKSRFGHPTMSGDATGTTIGRLKNFQKETRLDGDIIARADLHLGGYAFNAPKADYGTYTLNLAEEDPEQFGMSVVFHKIEERRLNENNTLMTDEEGKELLPLARIKQMYAGDVVDEPATGDGLFSELFDGTNVQFSAEMTNFLNDYLTQPDALNNILSFLDRYSENAIYRSDKAIQEKLKLIKEKLTNMEVNMLTPEQIEEKRLKDEEAKKLAAATATAATAVIPLVIPPVVQTNLDIARTIEIQEATKERILNIQKAGAAFGVPQASIDEFIAKDVSLEAATVQMLAWRDKQTVDIPTQQGNASLQFQTDEHEKKTIAFGEAMCVRYNLPVEGDDGQSDAGLRSRVAKSEFRNMSLQKLAQYCLMGDGDPMAYTYDGDKLYRKIMLGAGGAAQGTGDFINVLSNVFKKASDKGWGSVKPTYQLWTGRDSLADFKTSKIIRLSGLSDLKEIREGSGPEYGAMTDIYEEASLRTYGTIYSLSRQAMINDDLAMLTRIPEKQMALVPKFINKMVYQLLLSQAGLGPTMKEDSKTLFHADHANLAGAGAAPDITTLTAGRTAVAKMKQLNPDNNRSDDIYMGLKPKFILVGTTDEMPTWNIFNWDAINIDTAYKEGTRANNFYKSEGRMNVISEPYLEDYAGGGDRPWYLICDQNEVDVITVYFLRGAETPYTAMGPNEIGYGRGLRWVLEYDIGVSATDWRGLYKNPGA